MNRPLLDKVDNHAVAASGGLRLERDGVTS